MIDRASRFQQGFSIIELVVALLLGSLITIAAVSLFGTNQRTFMLQQGITSVQEQGRFALDYMSLEIRKLGYMELADAGLIPAGQGTRPGLVRSNINLGGVTYPAASEGGGAADANDRLTFSYMAGPGDADCEGDSPAARSFIVVTYWVDDNDVLWCRGSADPGSTGVELVRGVRSFQVLYGLDGVVDEQPEVRQYVRADAVGAADVVLAVRVGLLLGERVEGVPPVPAGRNFLVLDKSLQSGAAPLDREELLRVFTTTVKARNYDSEGV